MHKTTVKQHRTIDGIHLAFILIGKCTLPPEARRPVPIGLLRRRSAPTRPLVRELAERYNCHTRFRTQQQSNRGPHHLR